MNHLLKQEGEKKVISYLTLLLFGFFLNQSGSIFGLNISITDFFFLLMIMSLIIKKTFVFKPIFILFFISISTVGLFSSVFYAPVIFPIVSSGYDVLTNFIKFTVVFLYMILGYNIARFNYDRIVIHSFSFGGMIIGLIGIFLTVTHLEVFQDLFYYESSRFKGLMNDPNYYAIIQVAVISCVVNNGGLSKVAKSILSILLIVSIFISGSKTGFITLVLYFVFKTAENVIVGRNKVSSVVVLFTIALLLLVNPFSYLITIINKLSTSIPILFRISNLLNDPIEAASSGGSGRTEIWIESINIIEKSPILGVGFGTFSDIMHVFRGSGELAHNTYIQIVAEWGLLLGGLSIIFIIILLVKNIFIERHLVERHIVKDIVIVLLIGSLGVSLNNSRLLWFFIGVLIYYSTSKVGTNLKKKGGVRG